MEQRNNLVLQGTENLGMIQASKAGFLFRSTDKIKADYPQIPAYETYEELLGAIKKAMDEK